MHGINRKIRGIRGIRCKKKTTEDTDEHRGDS
nr:MAG TPA: hypothetical protein [Caudoviricetes sp.]